MTAAPAPMSARWMHLSPSEAASPRRRANGAFFMTTRDFLKPGEQLCDLGRRGMQLIQMPGEGCFSQDSVLLADFAGAKQGTRLCDLGAGSGAVSLLILAREPEVCCDLVEIQERLCDRARRSAALNNLADRVHVHCLDLKEAPKALGQGTHDLVVANPPYHPVTGDEMREADRLARQQIACDDEALVHSAAKLLRHHGRLCLCFPAAKLLVMADILRKHQLEPKRLRLVASFADREPYLCLVEGMKGAKPGLKVLPQLTQFEAPGRWSREMAAIYQEGGDRT